MLYWNSKFITLSFLFEVIWEMTINALICDDQIQCTQIVQQYLVKYCDERNYTCFCDLFDNGEKALNATKRYDIAFLDIEVGNINGLDIAKKLKENLKWERY